MRSRALVYVGSLLATIALINTPVPRVVVSAVLNPEAGEAVARSLGWITRDLVLVLLVSVYFEWGRSREQVQLLHAVDRKIEALQIVMEPSIRKLAQFEGALHQDVSVALRVESVDDNVLQVSSRYEVTMPRGPVLVAATWSPTHAGALIAVCPELFEVVTLPRSTPFREAVNEFEDRLECYVGPEHGTMRKAEFRRVPTSALRRHISLPVGMTDGDVVLFLADLSREAAEFVRVRHHYRWSQTLAEHFVFWSAIRPMFVRTVAMDFRELVKDDAREVWVQPFLDGVDSLLLDTEDGHLQLRLDRWVMQGQGIAAIW